MILFALPLYRNVGQELGRTIPGLEFGESTIKRFSNAEIYIETSWNVKGERCLILGSIAPPDEQLLAVSLLSHTLKRREAKEVVGLFPYLGYARQDKAKTDQSLTLAWAGQVLKASGLDRIITIDVHSPLADYLIPIPVTSYLATELFIETITNLHHPIGLTLIAPDQGADNRVHAIATAIGSDIPVVTFNKERTDKSLVHAAPQKPILTKSVVIIDDILDTGGTLLSCINHLKASGVDSVVIAITHGLFTGNEWRKLFDVGVNHIYVTDSTPEAMRNRTNQVCKISAIPLLQKMIGDLLQEERQ